MNLKKHSTEFWHKFWRDKEGKVVIWQTPNFPLTMWAIFFILSKVISAGGVRNGIAFLSTAFIFTWAYMEITSGASYFRRLLGAIIFINIIISRLK